VARLSENQACGKPVDNPREFSTGYLYLGRVFHRMPLFFHRLRVSFPQDF
jgi:hypothetical protein